MSETRPKRGQRSSADDDFEDPLSNYSPAEYDGELDRALAESTVSAMQHTPVATISPDQTVADVMQTMADNSYFGLLVVEEGKLIGIFTERDVLNKIVDEYNTKKDHPIRLYMTPDPVRVYNTDCPAKAINVMAVGGFRRVPVLDMEDGVVGIIGPKRTVRFLQKYIE